MSNEITVIPPGALQRIGPALQEYARVSGRTSEQVLAKKGQDLAMRQPGNSLQKLFRDEAARPGAITRDTAARGFRLGRRNFGGTGETAGISETAYRRTVRIMGDHANKTILANPRYQDGVIKLGSVRMGKSGKRITGGKRGIGGVSVGGDSDLRREGDKRLNFRAVATIMEINLREQGREFLGAAFMFRRFARVNKERVIRNQNARARVSLQGQAALEGATQAGNVALRISSFVPGTKSIGNTRGLFSRALTFMQQDMEKYIADKQRAELVNSLRKIGLSAA